MKKKSYKLGEKKSYKLGEEIAYGVKYFGREKSIDKVLTAMCICPRCNELWRVPLCKVRSGARISCCGRGRPKTKNN